MTAAPSLAGAVLAVAAPGAEAGRAAVVACISPTTDAPHEARMDALAPRAVHDALNAIDVESFYAAKVAVIPDGPAKAAGLNAGRRAAAPDLPPVQLVLAGRVGERGVPHLDRVPLPVCHGGGHERRTVDGPLDGSALPPPGPLTAGSERPGCVHPGARFVASGAGARCGSEQDRGDRTEGRCDAGNSQERPHETIGR